MVPLRKRISWGLFSSITPTSQAFSQQIYGGLSLTLTILVHRTTWKADWWFSMLCDRQGYCSSRPFGDVPKVYVKSIGQCWPRGIKSESFIVWMSCLHCSEGSGKSTWWRSQLAFIVAAKDELLSTQKELTVERPLGGCGNSIQQNLPCPEEAMSTYSSSLQAGTFLDLVPPAHDTYSKLGEEKKGWVGLKRCLSTLLPPWSFYSAARLSWGRRDGPRVHQFRAHYGGAAQLVTGLKRCNYDMSAHQIFVSWGICEVTDLPGSGGSRL